MTAWQTEQLAHVPDAALLLQLRGDVPGKAWRWPKCLCPCHTHRWRKLISVLLTLAWPGCKICDLLRNEAENESSLSLSVSPCLCYSTLKKNKINVFLQIMYHFPPMFSILKAQGAELSAVWHPIIDLALILTWFWLRSTKTSGQARALGSNIKILCNLVADPNRSLGSRIWPSPFLPLQLPGQRISTQRFFSFFSLSPPSFPLTEPINHLKYFRYMSTNIVLFWSIQRSFLASPVVAILFLLH